MWVSIIVLVLAADAASEEPPIHMRMHLGVEESANAHDFRDFLQQRATEIWPQLELDGLDGLDELDGLDGLGGLDGQPPGETEAFVVTVSWPSESTVLVHVEQSGLEIAHRQIPIVDLGAAKLTVWMVVKSAIGRSLRVIHNPKPPPKTMPQPQTELETPAAARVPAASPEPTAASSAVQVSSRPINKSQKRLNESQKQPWGMGVLVGITMGSPRLLHVGPAFSVWGQPWRRLWLAGELGYALTPGVTLDNGHVGLLIHHIPLRLLMAWQLDAEKIFAAGAFATTNTKFAMTQATSKTAIGLDVGAFIQAQVPMSASHSLFLARLALGARPLRHRYVLEDETMEEQLWVASISSGVSW